MNQTVRAMRENPSKIFLILLFAIVFLCDTAAAQAQPRYRKLSFRDEFNGPAGAAVDASKWTAETGGGGWGNKELQYYTNSTQNAATDGAGSLVIRAVRLSAPLALNCWYGPCQYTSARLVTKGKFEQKHGRFEARIRIPRGQGIWPAFWMLGNDIGSSGWPQCGEIDIVENIGREPSIVHGTVHGPGYSGANAVSGAFSLPGNPVFADDYHVYATEWSENSIRFYVDGNLYKTVTPQSLPAGSAWVFEHPFFMIMNVAVGGQWPGSPDGSSVFPQTMMVDYVRVYGR